MTQGTLRERADVRADEIIRLLEEQESSKIRSMDLVEQKASSLALRDAYFMARMPVTRQLICDLIGRQRDSTNLHTLLHALDDCLVGVRASAADAIGKIFGYVDRPPLDRREEVLARLMVAWHAEKSDDVRSTLVQTLALLGDARVVPLLRELLGDSSARIRTQARWGLRFLGALK
ncbi:MAG TPA: HEAT repeat domain-containing protein [Pilimelia sp.]|nr:HEAT repeat domain-containing protein [Pilimelia sp.]